ncbi:MAG: HAD family hydrolase [Candidatus Pacebacteria bacterium]|nr:HAD family hydrolase [Candidatus Paceibacterota bacterium]
MEKQIIFFDIDNTLFDVNTFFNKYLIPASEKDLGISKEKFEKVSQVYKESLEKGTEFNPEGWLAEAKRQLGKKADGISELFSNPDFFVGSLFAEVIPILSDLKNDYVLGIFSEGLEEWQRKKIELSGINNYFEQKYISISSDKVSEKVLSLIPLGALIVDDRAEIVLELGKRDGIHPILLNRKFKDAPPNTKVIKDLTGLLPMLERIRLESPPQS